MKFNIITFGCKVNWCESESIFTGLVNNNFLPCENFENADIVIINSCTVTAESDRKIRQKIHKIKRLNPNCTLVLTGCMAEIAKKNNQTISGVDILVGNKSSRAVISEVLKYFSIKISNYNQSSSLYPTPYPLPEEGDEAQGAKPPATPFLEKLKHNENCFENLALNLESRRTRSFLKIEDGCNRFCTYCIIPFSRGTVRSKPLKEIKKDTEKLAVSGYKEIVLVGINLSLYGSDLGYTLADAVHTVCEISGIKRVRLSSLEPELLDENLILQLAKEEKLCPQFHLSLQSGCDQILKKMGRRYTRDEYLIVVKNLKKHFKNVTFTTDLMVGFPGETEENFNDSLSLISEVNFLKVHVFPYSVRPGTKAAEFPDQISKKIKSERVAKALKAAEIAKNRVLEENKGKTLNVLFETTSKNEKGENIYEGYTENYIPVKREFDKDVCGEIVEVCL